MMTQTIKSKKQGQTRPHAKPIRRNERVSLYPLEFEEVMADILKMPPEDKTDKHNTDSKNDKKSI